MGSNGRMKSGDITNADDLRDWLALLVARGALHNDAILLAEAFRAAHETTGRRSPRSTILRWRWRRAASGISRRPRKAMPLFSRSRKSWACDTLDLVASDGDVAYPVAVAMAAAGHGLPLAATLDMFCLGFVSNLVSAAIRLGIVGQTDGQGVIAALLPAIRETASSCATASLDDLGASAFRSDLASLRHETQYTRLFRS